MIAQKRTSYTIKPQAGRFAIYDKDGKYHGSYTDRGAADAYVAAKELARTKAKRATHDLVLDASMAVGGVLLAVALLWPGHALAGAARTCRPIAHGTACYVGNQRVSVVCRQGYQLTPAHGSRCVKVR